MTELEKKVRYIVFSINNALKNRNLGTFLSSHKLLFYKKQEFTEEVNRRVGKDDRHENTKKTSFSFENLGEYPISNELSSKIQDSLVALIDFETSSFHYYGSSDNYNSYTEILLDKSRSINHQLDKYNSSELLSENRMNKILFYYLQDLNEDKYNNEVPSKHVEKWYIYLTSIKTLLFLIFSEKAKNTYYQDLVIWDESFWDKFFDYTKCKFNESFLVQLDKVYEDNKSRINEFVKEVIDDLCFEKVIKELLVSTIEEINVLKVGIIINRFHKYFNS